MAALALGTANAPARVRALRSNPSGAGKPPNNIELCHSHFLARNEKVEQEEFIRAG